MNTIGTQSLEFHSGFTGWLIGITVFTNAVDPNDRFRVTLKGRDLKQWMHPQANFSIEEDFFEEIHRGNKVTLYYQSTGTTSKIIDFTPRIRYPLTLYSDD